MKPDLSAAALVPLLHQYYPTDRWADEPGYKESEQIQRLQRLLEEARKDMRAWEGFVQRVREEFPDSTFWDTTQLFYDPCYRLRTSLPLPKEAEDPLPTAATWIPAGGGPAGYAHRVHLRRNAAAQ